MKHLKTGLATALLIVIVLPIFVLLLIFDAAFGIATRLEAAVFEGET